MPSLARLCAALIGVALMAVALGHEVAERTLTRLGCADRIAS